MKKLLIILTLSLLALDAFAQRTVQGRIVDDRGEPAIGATIVVRGTAIGTATDWDGIFSLQIPNGDVVLIISYIGFENREITINSSGEFTVRTIRDDPPRRTY